MLDVEFNSFYQYKNSHLQIEGDVFGGMPCREKMVSYVLQHYFSQTLKLLVCIFPSDGSSQLAAL